MHAVLNNSVAVPDGLRGAHLSIGTTLWSDMYLKYDGDGNLFGFERDLLNELSRRASFTYDLSVLDMSPYESWTAGLLQEMKSHDVVTTSYWAITPERTLGGAFSPYGYHDASMILVSYK
jgi:hypothetical protein